MTAQSGPEGGERPTGLGPGLVEVYRHMSAGRRRQFLVLLALMVAGAFAELGTIGAVLPFLTLLADPATLDRLPVAAGIFSSIGAESIAQQLLAATLLFSLVVIVAGMVRFQLAKLMQEFGFQLAHDLTLEVQRSFLLQPYSFHIAHNTSTLITNALDKVEALVFEVLIPSMQAATAGFIALFIIAALILVDPLTAIIAAIAFSSIYGAVSIFSRSRIAANSDVMSRGFDERMRITQEGLGGIRDVIIDGSHSLYLADFERVNSKFNEARANNLVIASTPRFIIETIGIVAIAGIAYAASQRAGGFAAALPVLGAIALGAQRLLPLIQQVYSGWSTASGYLPVVGETLDLLRLPADESEFKSGPIKPLAFTDRIGVEHVSFTYPTRESPTLSDVSLEIPHGSTTAVMGRTGSGKSTLVDLIMGLLPPDEGSISIDGVVLTERNRRRWQRCIAHVPQSIFLADATIARNIAIGMGDKAVDPDRVIKASKKAQLHEFVSSLPDGYDTFVGERGIRLSGGQRQRLGLARAIYKDTPLLVLDEATSALDEATEAAVFNALEQLRREGRTIIVIAHRLSTIARCDCMVRLNEGRIVQAAVAGGRGSRPGARRSPQAEQPFRARS